MHLEIDSSPEAVIARLIDEAQDSLAVDVYHIARKAMALLPDRSMDELARAAALEVIRRNGNVAWNRDEASASCA